MSEQGNEFELDVDGHRQGLLDDDSADVEGHRAGDKAGLHDDKAGVLEDDVEGHKLYQLIDDEDDVEGHVQPPRDADLGSTER